MLYTLIFVPPTRLLDAWRKISLLSKLTVFSIWQAQTMLSPAWLFWVMRREEEVLSALLLASSCDFGLLSHFTAPSGTNSNTFQCLLQPPTTNLSELTHYTQIFVPLLCTCCKMALLSKLTLFESFAFVSLIKAFAAASGCWEELLCKGSG